MSPLQIAHQNYMETLINVKNVKRYIRKLVLSLTNEQLRGLYDMYS